MIANTTRRMEADIEHFRTKLGKINGAGEVGDKLLELVQAKTTTAPPPEPEAKSASQNQEQDNRSESAES